MVLPVAAHNYINALLPNKSNESLKNANITLNLIILGSVVLGNLKPEFFDNCRLSHCSLKKIYDKESDFD